MKPLLLLAILLTLTSCPAKSIHEMSRNYTRKPCLEKPPTEMCDAYFERWFYNSKTGNCKKIAYSGCKQYGFETEKECLSCNK